MLDEDIADTDGFITSPKDFVVNLAGGDGDPGEALGTLLGEDADPEEVLEGLQGALLGHKIMDQLNSNAKDVMQACLNYTLAVGVVLMAGLNCTRGNGCNLKFLTSGLDLGILPFILSVGYGIFIIIITWTHGTYFAKKKGKSNFEGVYDFTDKIIGIDSLIEIPIGLYAAPYVTIALWMSFAIVGLCVVVLSVGVDDIGSLNTNWASVKKDPAKVGADLVAVYHLYKVTGDFSQYYVLNKTTDENKDFVALNKMKALKKKAARFKWSPNNKTSLKGKAQFGGYFISACVIILLAFSAGVYTIISIKMINGDESSDDVNIEEVPYDNICTSKSDFNVNKKTDFWCQGTNASACEAAGGNYRVLDPNGNYTWLRNLGDCHFDGSRTHDDCKAIDGFTPTRYRCAENAVLSVTLNQNHFSSYCKLGGFQDIQNECCGGALYTKDVCLGIKVLGGDYTDVPIPIKENTRPYEVFCTFESAFKTDTPLYKACIGTGTNVSGCVVEDSGRELREFECVHPSNQSHTYQESYCDINGFSIKPMTCGEYATYLTTNALDVHCSDQYLGYQVPFYEHVQDTCCGGTRYLKDICNFKDGSNVNLPMMMMNDDDKESGNNYDILKPVNIGTLIVTGLAFLSSLLLIKATWNYKTERESTGIALFRYGGWIFFVIGVGFQVVLWKWYSISIISGAHENGKAMFNTACIMSYSIATLFIIIHALAARQI